MANKGKILTREAAFALKRMYEERDSLGRRVWTQMKLAKEFRCGETTIFRALQSFGAYDTVPEQKTESELQQGAGESLKKLLTMMPELAANASVSAVSKMQAAATEIKKKSGDALLKELTGDKDA